MGNGVEVGLGAIVDGGVGVVSGVASSVARTRASTVASISGVGLGVAVGSPVVHAARTTEVDPEIWTGG